MVLLGIVLAVIVIDQVMLAVERRGWVRWRRSPPKRTSVSNAALHVQALFEPDRAHVVEQRQHDDLDIDVASERLSVGGGLTPRGDVG